MPTATEPVARGGADPANEPGGVRVGSTGPVADGGTAEGSAEPDVGGAGLGWVEAAVGGG